MSFSMEHGKINELIGYNSSKILESLCHGFCTEDNPTYYYKGECQYDL